MVDVVSSSLPFLADKPTIKRVLEECKGNIDSAVSKLLDSEEGGSVSSAQESSSVEREPDSDDELLGGPNKKQDRRMSRTTRQKPKDLRQRQIMSKLASHDSSQESIASQDSDGSSPEAPSRLTEVKAEDLEEDKIRVKQDQSTSSDPPAKPTIRIRISPPKRPDSVETTTNPSNKQNGHAKVTARDKKDIKKQAQKAARKERQQAAVKGGTEKPTVKTGIALRSKGMTNTPPIESGFRTLFI